MPFMRLVVVILAIGLLAWFGLQIVDQESVQIPTGTDVATQIAPKVTQTPDIDTVSTVVPKKYRTFGVIVADLGKYVNLRFSPTDKEDNIMQVLTTGTIVQYIRCEEWVPVVYNETVNGFVYYEHIDACR